jgi:lysophospholipase L1-like esterase
MYIIPEIPSITDSLSFLNGCCGIKTMSRLAYKLPSINLPIFRQAVLNSLNGISDTKILCIGDSTTAGVGSSTQTTIPAAKGFPRQLAEIFSTRLCKSAQGIGNPRRFSGDPDNRWTYGTGWNFGGFSWSDADGSTPAGILKYTPDGGTTFDGFDVYYIKNSGLGTITVTATGGSAVVVNTSAAAGVGKATVMAATAAGNNSVEITGSGNCYILGVEPFLSTQRRIRVGNVGVPGSTSTSWNTATTGYTRMASLITYAPHLTIVSLGLNDAGSSVSTATLETNLNAIITAAKTVGDVILWTPPPPTGAPYQAGIASYQATYAAVAVAQSIPLVDIYTRFGGTWNASLMTDSLHPNDSGYLIIAEEIYSALF